MLRSEPVIDRRDNTAHCPSQRVAHRTVAFDVPGHPSAAVKKQQHRQPPVCLLSRQKNPHRHLMAAVEHAMLPGVVKAAQLRRFGGCLRRAQQAVISLDVRLRI